jgi:hypothetical protein
MKCPICQSEKWMNGVCGKCSYKNDKPFGRVDTGLGKKQQIVYMIAKKKGSATIEDVMMAYDKKDVKKEYKKLVESGYFKEISNKKGVKLCLLK